MGRRSVRLGIALASAVAVLPALEIALRIWNPTGVQLFRERFQGTPGERVLVIDPALDVHPEYGIFQVDSALGYRPVPGGKTYDVHGAKRNEYALEKPAGKRRLLFIGDSVTDRARHQHPEELAVRVQSRLHAGEMRGRVEWCS